MTMRDTLVRRDIYGYIVPFAKSLASLIRMPDIMHYIDQPHTSSAGYMFYICDGQVVQTDPLFMTNPRALQVIIHTDDIEIVNPIGSHTKKHELSMFYYTLGNIPPEFRSQLHAI